MKNCMLASGLLVCGMATTVANSGVFYCCRNDYLWDGGKNPACSGTSHKICDVDLVIDTCPSFQHHHPTSMTRPRGCTTFTGDFINAVCDPTTYPNPPYTALPGFPGGGCCYSKATPVFKQDGGNTIEICAGACTNCS